MASSDAHTGVFQKIDRVAKYFQRTPKSGLLFCACDDPGAIAQINRLILRKAGDADLKINTTDLSESSPEMFNPRIREAVFSKPDGVIVNGLDDLILTTGDQVFARMNNSREALLEHGVALLFWVSEKNVSRIANKAPDLFVRRDRGVINFKPDELDIHEFVLLQRCAEREELRATIFGLEQHSQGIPADVLKRTLLTMRGREDELRLQIERLESADSRGKLAKMDGRTVEKGPAKAETSISKSQVAVVGDHANVFGDINYYDRNGKIDREKALAAYLRTLCAATCHLPLRGVDLGASDPECEKKRMDLARVYIDLDTTTRKEEKPRRDKWFRRGEFEIALVPNLLGAAEAAWQTPRMVLLGDPGSGKSTFLNHLVFCLANHGLEPEAGWLDRLTGWEESQMAPVSVLVVLRDFADKLTEDARPEVALLWEFVKERLAAKNLGFATGVLEEILEDGRALVLLDGLDEISKPFQRKLVRDTVGRFVERYPKSRMIVTCRTLSYQDEAWKLPGFDSFELAPFDVEKIERFIEAWYRELFDQGEVKNREDADNLAARLKTAVRKPDLKRLAPTPLLLTVMAIVNTHKGRLPDARALLYEETVDILLWRWDSIRLQGKDQQPRLSELLHQANRTDVDLKSLMWRLAFHAHGQSGTSDKEGLADIAEWRLEKELAGLHPDESLVWARQMVQAIRERAGLLLERQPGVYTFPHRTFQEFLAGAHLSRQNNFVKQATELAGQGAFWREVILLAVGRLVYLSGDSDRPLALAAELCPEDPADIESSWKKAWLAGEVLCETGVHRVKESTFGKDILNRVRRRLVSLLEKGKLEPMERVKAGNTLSMLGDPRFRKDFWYLPDDPDMGFVQVPDGTFWMGSDEKRDPDAREDEFPRHKVHLSTYRIAKYPVTVAQYRAYLKDSGLKPDNLWLELNRYDNHPVVAVSWEEATKYCEWLSEKLDDSDGEFSLPTEAQWERAARGNDERKYPWGDVEISSNKANYWETRILTTSPVGSFPAGESPYRAVDMAGNAYEWCRDRFGEYLDDEETNPEGPASDTSRILRGGFWGSMAINCRSANRSRFVQSFRRGNYGFRLVLLPSHS